MGGTPVLIIGRTCVRARLDRPNDGSRSAGEGLCVLQSFLFTTQQEAFWLQILKTNYNDKIPPFGGLIELSGFIRKRDTEF